MDYGLPILFTMFVWWFSTGAILYLVSLADRTYRWSLVGATAVLIAGLYGVAATAGDTTVAGAYLAFACALAVWGWVEMTYFMGLITGPRKEPCPPDCSAWRRFGLGIQASLYHELAIIGFGLGIIALTWNAPNQVGMWTFVILWTMRWSAKLNLFLGVPNLNEEFLPEHLRFLKTFIAKRRMNPLFPVSVTISTVIVWLLIDGMAGGTGVEIVAGTLLATLLALAILEHWFMVLPLPDAALWQWMLGDRDGTEKTPDGQIPSANNNADNRAGKPAQREHRHASVAAASKGARLRPATALRPAEAELATLTNGR
ncbi:MAG: putative photosynthetic complex assembly protein PuhE [Alphaproteobacteria bacterium]